MTDVNPFYLGTFVIIVSAILGVGTELTGGLFGVPSIFIGLGGAVLVLLVGHVLLSGSEPRGSAMSGN